MWPEYFTVCGLVGGLNLAPKFLRIFKDSKFTPPFPHKVFLPSGKSDFVKAVMKRQKNIAEVFLKHKDLIHEAEDPECLIPMSDILDIRNWNLESFDPKDKENQHEDDFFTEEVKECGKSLKVKFARNFTRI